MLAAIAGAYVLLCSISAARHSTEIDCANYCIGLLRYDIQQHSPHPPGYPLYTLAGRLLQFVTQDPHLALTVLSRVLGAASVLAIYPLARTIFTPGHALWITALCLFNPVSLFYGSVALSAVSGLFFGPLVVLFASRSLAGRPSGLILSSLALGIAGGFRQDLLVFLLAPWSLALLRSPLAWRTKGLAVATLLAAVGAWLLPMISLTGGLDRYREACGLVTGFASRESLTLEGGLSNFLRNLVRFCAATVAATGVLGVGALLQRGMHLRRKLAPLLAPSGPLLASWVLPPLLFFLIVFIHKPGYLLPVLPGLIIVAFAELIGPGQDRQRGITLMMAGSSIALSLAFFTACPSIERFSGAALDYRKTHEQLSAGKRLVRQFTRLTEDEIRVQDEQIEETNDLIAGLERELGDVAIVTLPDNRFDLRVAMYEWPALDVHHVNGPPEGIQSVSLGRGLRHEMMQPDPGMTLHLGSPGGHVAWVATYSPQMGSVLERAGAREVRGPQGSRLWITEGGRQPLVWSE